MNEILTSKLLYEVTSYSDFTAENVKELLDKLLIINDERSKKIHGELSVWFNENDKLKFCIAIIHQYTGELIRYGFIHPYIKDTDSKWVYSRDQLNYYFFRNENDKMIERRIYRIDNLGDQVKTCFGYSDDGRRYVTKKIYVRDNQLLSILKRYDGTIYLKTIYRHRNLIRIFIQENNQIYCELKCLPNRRWKYYINRHTPGEIIGVINADTKDVVESAYALVKDFLNKPVTISLNA